MLCFCAAILHDTIEDTETMNRELVREFGREIADVVKEVTDNKRRKSPVRKRLQIKHASTASSFAKFVKLADKICNLHDLGSTPPVKWPVKWRREYFDWAEKVVAGLCGVNGAVEAAFDSALTERPLRPLHDLASAELL
jgi:guanosine-3',5'-bis(diphosphate) 3'-pyrophosphohydrolase